MYIYQLAPNIFVGVRFSPLPGTMCSIPSYFIAMFIDCHAVSMEFFHEHNLISVTISSLIFSYLNRLLLASETLQMYHFWPPDRDLLYWRLADHTGWSSFLATFWGTLCSDNNKSFKGSSIYKVPGSNLRSARNVLYTSSLNFSHHHAAACIDLIERIWSI